MNLTQTREETFLFPFWGKTDRIRGGRHSHLLAHMLAVGAVFEKLLAIPSITRVIEASSGKPDASMHPLLIWVALLHDIGKLLPQFQNKCDWVLKEIGRPPPGKRIDAPFAHGDEGYHQLAHGDGDGVMRQLCDRAGWSEQQMSLFGSLWIGACAHHGHHVTQVHRPAATGSRESRFAMKKAIELALFTRDIVERNVGPVIIPELMHDKALVQVFSGLVALSDWIGSDEENFAFISIPRFEKTYLQDTTALDQLYQLYRELAANRISDLKFATPAAPDFNTLEAAFGKEEVARAGFQLRPMQQAVYDAVSAAATGAVDANLLIIEDTMGSGKTEAALIGAAEWIRQGRAQGTVFALPSQASADQTFSRLHFFSHALFGVDPNLSHSNTLFARQRITNEQSTGNESAEHLSDWITSHSKRAFLAPVCAATVDQIMLAAMDCRHGFVRAACITRHVVIIDEIHAYDEYMGSILYSLLELLGSCGTPVILLSATLPQAARQRYINAYRKGRGQCTSSTLTTIASAYPLLTISGDEMTSQHVSVGNVDNPKKTVNISVASKADIYQKVVHAASTGCAAIVCNTVASAIRRAEELKTLVAGTDIKVILLHARFRLRDRAAIGEHLAKVCGKSSVRTSRCGNIIIASQVIEQSLDLDFDYMASEPAPIDLLMQRMGRLFRHERDWRPDEFLSAQFDMIEPTAAGTTEDEWMFGTRKVYGNESILNGSIAWMEVNSKIVIPEGICTAVSDVYDKFIQNNAGYKKGVFGSEHALDFSLPLGENIVQDTSQSSDTRGSESSTKFLLVRTENGLPRDILTGQPMTWLDADDSDALSLKFLLEANIALVSIRTSPTLSFVKHPLAGDDMLKMAQSSELNKILASKMNYPPFFIVECCDQRTGSLDDIDVGMGHRYGKKFGFK